MAEVLDMLDWLDDEQIASVREQVVRSLRANTPSGVAAGGHGLRTTEPAFTLTDAERAWLLYMLATSTEYLEREFARA